MVNPETSVVLGMVRGRRTCWWVCRRNADCVSLWCKWGCLRKLQRSHTCDVATVKPGVRKARHSSRRLRSCVIHWMCEGPFRWTRNSTAMHWERIVWKLAFDVVECWSTEYGIRRAMVHATMLCTAVQRWPITRLYFRIHSGTIFRPMTVSALRMRLLWHFFQPQADIC